jgi:hypothetical protein
VEFKDLDITPLRQSLTALFKSNTHQANALVIFNPQQEGGDCPHTGDLQACLRLVRAPDVQLWHGAGEFPQIGLVGLTPAILNEAFPFLPLTGVNAVQVALPSQEPPTYEPEFCTDSIYYGDCKLAHPANSEMELRLEPENTYIYKTGLAIPFRLNFTNGPVGYWESFQFCRNNGAAVTTGTLPGNQCNEIFAKVNKKVEEDYFDPELFYFDLKMKLIQLRGVLILQASSNPDCSMDQVRNDLLWMNRVPQGKDWRNVGCLNVRASIEINPPKVGQGKALDDDIIVESLHYGVESVFADLLPNFLIEDEVYAQANKNMSALLPKEISPVLEAQILPFFNYQPDAQHTLYAEAPPPNAFCLPFNDPNCLAETRNDRLPAALTRTVFGWFGNMFGPVPVASKTAIFPVKKVYDDPQPCIFGTPHKDRTDLCILCKEGETILYDTVLVEDVPSEVIFCKSPSHGVYNATILPRAQRHFVEYAVMPQIDSDGDGILDSRDNCPGVADLQYKATGQPGTWFSDEDGDGVGFLCDNCPLVANPDQGNSDADWLGDACDPCKSLVKDTVCCNSNMDCEVPVSEEFRKNFCAPISDIPQVTSGVSSLGDFGCTGFYGRCTGPLDEDRDGIPNNCDNCPLDPNASQVDSNGNGAGDVCEGCGGLNPRIPPDVAANIPPHSLSKFPCDPMEGPHAPAPAHASCQAKTKNPKSRCVWKNVLFTTPVGVCTVGPDEDGDGVADNCDNCKSIRNPDQANCNIEAEIVAGVPYPYTGDLCDPRSCALVSQYNMELSSGSSPNGLDVARLQMKPRILPPETPGAYSFTSDQTLPLATVGNSFCACGNRDGVARFPYQCQADALGRCIIRPDGYYESPEEYTPDGPMGNWTKPELQPTTTLYSSWSPQGGTTSVLFALPMSNVNPQQISEPIDPKKPPKPINTAKPSYPLWNLSAEPHYGPFLANSTLEVSCKDGRGVQGVFWTSIRGILGLSPSFKESDTNFTSYYEYGQWGVQAVCLKNPGSGSQTPPPPETQSLCFWCGCPMCGFKGLPNYNIYINPGDLAKEALFASDGLLTKKVADVPAALGEIWSAGDGIWVSASDWFHTHARGSDLATLSRDGLRVTSAAYFERGVAIPVRGGRLPGGLSAMTEPEQAVSSMAPAPRETFAATLSKKKNILFLAGGMQGNLPQTDLWQMSLESGSWEPLVLPNTHLGRVVAMTYHGPEEVLYMIDEKKTGKASWMRLVKVDPILRTAAVLGIWPKIGLFDRYFLSVAQSGELLLAASRGKGNKGKHFLIVFNTEGDRLWVSWTLGGHGELGQAPALTQDGLTRPFTSAQFNEQRFVPYHELPRPKPRKAKGKLNFLDDRDLFLGCF